MMVAAADDRHDKRSLHSLTASISLRLLLVGTIGVLHPFPTSVIPAAAETIEEASPVPSPIEIATPEPEPPLPDGAALIEATPIEPAIDIPQIETTQIDTTQLDPAPIDSAPSWSPEPLTTTMPLITPVYTPAPSPTLTLPSVTSGSEKSLMVSEWIGSVGYYPPQDDDDFADAAIDPRDLEDFDGDGLDNMEEAWVGTDPYNYDTDNDSVSDGDEVNASELFGAQSSDPRDSSQTPMYFYDDYFLDDLIGTPVETNEPVLSPVESTTTVTVQPEPTPYASPPADTFTFVTSDAEQPVQDLGYRQDPLLYRADDQLAGSGFLPGSIFTNPCQREYRYIFTNWGALPARLKDLHQFGAVVGMQSWLEVTRQVVPRHPGFPDDCPDLTATQFRSSGENANVTFQYIGAVGFCDTRIDSGRPGFAAIRMANWSRFWTYLHELGHAIGLHHTSPLHWSDARANEFQRYGDAASSRAHCALMSYGHQRGWPMPACAGHPNDELRARAYYAAAVQRSRNYVCGTPVRCRLNRRTHQCSPEIPAGGNAEDYEDALHRPCWPRNQQPTAENVRYAGWIKEEFRCSRQPWRLMITFVPTTAANADLRGKCFVSIGRAAADRPSGVEYFRRGVGAYWEPTNNGTVIPLADRTRANCGLIGNFSDPRQ